MNETLQQRIDEAAKKFATTDGKIMSFAYLAAKQMADWVLQNQWISVEEGLPPCIEGKHYSEQCFCREQCEGYVTNSIQSYVYGETNHWALDHEYVTHWMPIPSLKGGEK